MAMINTLRRFGGRLAVLGLLAAVATAPALAAGKALFVEQASQQGFNGTVTALQRAISHNGMMVMGRVNQARVLSMTGLHLKGSQSFLVGNPTVGKKLFAMNPAVGAVLPLRVYVWQHAGHAYVGYFQPSALLGAVDAKLVGPGRMMDQKFAAIVQDATR